MSTRRRWTDTTIEAELAPIVADLGRMPTRTELTRRGLAGAWAAMQRRGGVPTWHGRLTHRAIELKAYFIAQQRGGDPLHNWLAAEAELLAA
jgi:Protein of unknown function (DUF2934)